jgi:hypothetical protein
LSISNQFEKDKLLMLLMRVNRNAVRKFGMREYYPRLSRLLPDLEMPTKCHYHFVAVRLAFRLEEE